MSVPISVAVVYEKNKHLFGSTLNWPSDTVKVVFLATAHTPDPAGDENYSDISGDAVSTPQALDGKTSAADGATGEGVHDATDESGIVVSAEWRYIVLFKDTGAGDGPLLFYGDAGSGQAAGTYNAVWSADGVMRVL